MAKAAAKSNPNKASGRWITTLEGYRAFYPNPLPPQLNWTPALATALADASMLVGRLAGEGRRLPNPHVLIRPFIRREAVLSSRIEGTQATLGELLAAEAGAWVERSPDDLREVGNYVKALEDWGTYTLFGQTLPPRYRLLFIQAGLMLTQTPTPTATITATPTVTPTFMATATAVK